MSNREKKSYGLLQALASLAAGSGDVVPVYSTLLCTGASAESLQALSAVGSIVGCSAVAITVDASSRAHFDRTFECMVAPVARDLSLELQASPFVAARCCSARNDDRL